MKQNGMTLVELMVVLVVASIIGIAVLNMFTVSSRTFMDQNKVVDVQREGRLVIDYLARTLRETGLNPHKSTAIEGIKYRYDADSAIIIDRDMNLNGTLDNDGKEVIGFKLREEPDGTKILMRGFDIGFGNERWHDMAKNIMAFSFEYFDATGAGPLPETTAYSAIRSIDVTLEFKDEKFMGGDFTRSYKSRIDFRN